MSKQLTAVTIKDKSNYDLQIAQTIINSSYSLTTNEKLFLYIILSKNKQIHNNTWYGVGVTEFWKVKKCSRQASFASLKEIYKNLFERVIKFKDLEGNFIDKSYRWIQARDLQINQEGTILYVKFTDIIVSSMNEKELWANLKLGEFKKLSPAAGRILELCSFTRYYRREGETRKISLGEFREMLQLNKTYEEYKYLKNRIINKAILELGPADPDGFKGIVNIKLVEHKSVGKSVDEISFKYDFFWDKSFVNLVDKDKRVVKEGK